MGRKSRGKPIHGWLVIDKPVGMSSNAVVVAVRRRTGAAKAGHAGTLDPLATGVLPIALGEATKTVPYAMDGVKTYAFTVCWGEARSTDDAEGEITEQSSCRPSQEEIEAVLPTFLGDIEQVPPIYSAIKVDGKRAYELARASKTVELKPRRIHIDSFRLVDMPDQDQAVFEVRSGKGAYMRALARDLAKALGTVGHITKLRRTAVGFFTESMAISLDKLPKMEHSAPPLEDLLPVETALADIPALALTEVEAGKLRQGQAVAALPVVSRSPSERIRQSITIRAMSGGRLVALAAVEGGAIRPLRVMNLAN